MAIDFYGPGASPQAIPEGHDFGNVRRIVREYEAATLAQNEKVAVAKVPAYNQINDLRYYHDALGATNGLEIGYESKDGTPVDPDAFAVVADASSAGNGRASFTPVMFTEDVYITVTKTGAGTATGTIGVVVDTTFVGA